MEEIAWPAGMIDQDRQQASERVMRWAQGLPNDMKFGENYLVIEKYKDEKEEWIRMFPRETFAKMFAELILKNDIAIEKFAEYSTQKGYGLEEDLKKKIGIFGHLDGLRQ